MTAGHHQITQLFPDLFVGVPEQTVRRVQAIIGSSRHEGYEPKRQDIEQLLELAAGTASHEDALAAARARFDAPGS